MGEKRGFLSLVPCGYEPRKEVRQKKWGEMMIVYVGKNRSETSESIVGEIIVLIGQSDAESFICFHHDRH